MIQLKRGRALLTLPISQRAVVVLRHCMDLSEQTVAHILGCTIGTVKSQNARGLRKLQTLLAPTRDSDSEVTR